MTIKGRGETEEVEEDGEGRMAVRKRSDKKNMRPFYCVNKGNYFRIFVTKKKRTKKKQSVPIETLCNILHTVQHHIPHWDSSRTG